MVCYYCFSLNGSLFQRKYPIIHFRNAQALKMALLSVSE